MGQFAWRRLEEVTKERDTLMRLLETLTPGDSEFYNNPEKCAAWIQERGDDAKAQILKRREAETERDHLLDIARQLVADYERGPQEKGNLTQIVDLARAALNRKEIK